jgi:hypothetical protein
VTVVFFWSAAARAVAPASPISFPAAGQHTRDPEPKSAPHDSKPKHTRKVSSHENRAGPDADARASAARGGRPRKGSLSLAPRTLGAPAQRAAAVGPSRSPTPPSPAATRARSRTVEVDRRDRHVLLERGRQSCRAVGADVVAYGGAAHPRFKAQVSAARFQAEARTKVARTRTRGGRLCCQGERSPRRATAQKHSHSPSPHIGRACAAGRGRGPKRPPTPSIRRSHPSRLRTSEVDLRDRRVLLERGRQSCRAVGADIVHCGGAAHPRFKVLVSATRFQAEARAREARTRTRGARRCCQGERSPRRATAQRLSLLPPRTLGAPARRAAAVGPSVPQPLHPSRPLKKARAPLRPTVVTVVFFWSTAARAVAPALPMPFPAAGRHTHDSKS